MFYKKTKKGYAIRLKRGEEIISCLKELAIDEDICGGYLFGIGAVNEVKLGYYDFQNKEYLEKSFDGDFELASMNGNISYHDGEPVAHCHAVLADKELKLVGGHLAHAKVAVTVEIFLTNINLKIERKFDEETGLNLMNFK
jgi:hypothetical protein